MVEAFIIRFQFRKKGLYDINERQIDTNLFMPFFRLRKLEQNFLVFSSVLFFIFSLRAT